MNILSRKLTIFVTITLSVTLVISGTNLSTVRAENPALSPPAETPASSPPTGFDALAAVFLRLSPDAVNAVLSYPLLSSFAYIAQTAYQTGAPEAIKSYINKKLFRVRAAQSGMENLRIQMNTLVNGNANLMEQINGDADLRVRMIDLLRAEGNLMAQINGLVSRLVHLVYQAERADDLDQLAANPIQVQSSEQVVLVGQVSALMLTNAGLIMLAESSGGLSAQTFDLLEAEASLISQLIHLTNAQANFISSGQADLTIIDVMQDYVSFVANSIAEQVMQVQVNAVSVGVADQIEAVSGLLENGINVIQSLFTNSNGGEVATEIEMIRTLPVPRYFSHSYYGYYYGSGFGFFWADEDDDDDD